MADGSKEEKETPIEGSVLGKRKPPETIDDTETVQPGPISRHPTAPTPLHVIYKCEALAIFREPYPTNHGIVCLYRSL